MRVAIAVLSIALLAAAGAEGKPLPVERVVIDTPHGPQAFMMEVASDKASQDRGLMFRKTLAPNAGMLFDFRQKVMTAFWMKDTPLSLDIIFVRADGTIASITARAVPYSTKEIISPEPIRAVLEINGGRAWSLGIMPGNRVHATAFGNAIKPAQKSIKGP